MYADPALLRQRPVRINFNDSERKLIDALTEYTGEQRAVLIRRLILDQAARILSGEADYAPNRQLFEQPHSALKSA